MNLSPQMRRSVRRSSIPCLLVLSAFALCLPAAAQQADETFEEEIVVDEVLIDALVTDPRGNLVLGLGEDDFVVEEDGEEMDLTGVTFSSNRRFLASEKVAEAVGVDPDEVPSNRYFVLFFHDQRQLLPRLTAQQLEAGRDAEKWVEGELLANDYVAVVGYDYGLKPFVDFTHDSDALTAAIEDAAAGYDPDAPPSELANREGPSLFAGLPDGEALRDASVRIYGALELIGEAAKRVRGRKNLVLFSLGFGEVDGFGFYRPDIRYFPDMSRQLNDGNVAVYSVDLISSSAFGGLRLRALDSSLSHLAAETGGRYYYTFVSFLTPLQQIAEDNNGYYLLSYRSPHPAGESGYQEVDVDTANPEFSVRARDGYLYGE